MRGRNFFGRNFFGRPPNSNGETPNDTIPNDTTPNYTTSNDTISNDSACDNDALDVDAGAYKSSMTLNDYARLCPYFWAFDICSRNPPATSDMADDRKYSS